VIGLLIGAGLIFGALFVTRSLSPSTITLTTTDTTTATVTTTSLLTFQVTGTTETASPVYVKITIGYLNGTSLGSFDMELFPQYAPKTVANFVSLVNTGFYDNLTWHRIEKGFVIQAGDPNTKNGGGIRSEWGQGTSGTTIPFENSSLHNYQWYVGMASTAAGVGGSSQFYINLVNNTSLDGKYAVFGKVINGTNVVAEIGQLPTEPVAGQDEPLVPILITSAVVLSSETT
jgi:cyclophilin family peptidyl-prolyl cis-trans isomerase